MASESGWDVGRPETGRVQQSNRRLFLVGVAGMGGALVAEKILSDLGLERSRTTAFAQERSSEQPPAPSSSGIPGIPLENGQGVFYSEDGVNGYKVEGPMSEVFGSRGGDAVWGRAISRSWRDELGRINQAFEKGIFQLSADGKGGFSLEFANIFDELHNLGKDSWLETYRQVPPATDWSSDQGKGWQEVVQNHLAIIDPYPALKQFILGDADNPNSDWISMYGLPVSLKDYGDWISLRMQRANLQLLKKDFSYGNKGDVLVANGGTVAKEAGGIIPKQALTQEGRTEAEKLFEAKYEVKDREGKTLVTIENKGQKHGLAVTNMPLLEKVTREYASKKGKAWKPIHFVFYNDYREMPELPANATGAIGNDLPLYSPESFSPYLPDDPEGRTGVYGVGLVTWGYVKFFEQRGEYWEIRGAIPGNYFKSYKHTIIPVPEIAGIDLLLSDQLFDFSSLRPNDKDTPEFAKQRRNNISSGLSIRLANYIQNNGIDLRFWPGSQHYDPETQQLISSPILGLK